MTELKPRTKTASKSDARSPAVRRAPHDDEVYGTLGALLGTLEVIATDDQHALSPLQSERMRGAVRLGSALQAQVEALLVLSDDELGTRLKRANVPLRPLIEHAVRGALRGFERANVALVLPTGDDWGTQKVDIDSSRVDRSLRALAEVLAQRVGDGKGSDTRRGGLVIAGARRLFEQHGGGLDVDPDGLTVSILLPAAEAP